MIDKQVAIYMPVITTNHLRKEYRVHRKEPGLKGSLKSLLHRQYKTVEAVRSINLSIEAGELVGFIGPNGAGKTTTLKMLAGLLYPTSGDARVMGFQPWQRENDYLKNMSLVMGQKAQLWWDLSLYDSLLFQRDIYEISREDFQRNLRDLTELLTLEPFIKVQVRKLSLGQRMRAELAAAFIYSPKVLFLDEPTIGLDVVVQKNIRDFIATYNKKHNATIILTSHYLEDVRELCKRVIVIDHGSIKFDGSTDELIAQHVDTKRIVLTFHTEVKRQDVEAYGDIESFKPLKIAILVPRGETTQRAAQMLTNLPVDDISIEEPRLEHVVRELFSGTV